MSGEKYRTITQSEYDRLQREAMTATTERERRRALERLNQRLAESARAAELANAALSARVSTLNSKIAAANKTASDLKKQLYDTVTSTNKALSDQRIKFEKDLAKTRSDFADVLDRNNRRIEHVIQKNADALQGEINKLRVQTAEDVKKLNNEIAALADKVGDPLQVAAMAQDYLDVALELLKESESYRHGLLLPGRIDQVIADIQKAQGTLKLSAGNPAAAAAALVHSQEAFESAKKFYDDLLAAENEWAAKMALAQEALAAAEARITANEKMDFFGEEQNVDHWANGGLKKLKDLTDTLRQRLEDPAKANALSCADLDGIAANAQVIADDADNVLTGARIALECSDDRAGLAADLAEDLAKIATLEQIEAVSYEGKDQRAANMIHLKNGTTDFEVIITLIPDFADGRCGWRAETKIVNQGNSAKTAAEFEKALKDVMRDHGLIGNCPIPVDTRAAGAVADWEERKKVSIPAIATPGADKILASQQ